MNITPFELLRTIDPGYEQKQTHSVLGKAPSFSWDKLSEQIGKVFNREGFAIIPGKLEWKGAEESVKPFGKNPFSFSLSFSGIEGECTWLFSTHDAEELSTWFLLDPSQSMQPPEKEVLHQFYQFFALKALHEARTLFETSLAPILSFSSFVENEKALCWDFSIQIGNETLAGRAIIPEKFRRSWIKHFSDTPLTQRQLLLANSGQIETALCIGRSFLSYDEWSAVQEGDVLIIEEINFDKEAHTGSVDLLFDGKRIYTGELEKGALKIVPSPLLQPIEDKKMAKAPNQDGKEELPDFDYKEDEEFESFDEDLFEDEENQIEESLHDEPTSEDEVKPKKKKTAPKPEAELSQEEEKKLISPTKIPLTLTVELARIKMPVETFLELEPGSLLQLEKEPKEQVTLSINGEVVARGELVMVGEMLGVRIDEVGC